MRFRVPAILTVALLINAVVLCAGERPTVSVMPDKVLYAPGETAKFDVTVVNGTKESIKGVLEVKVIWEMDDTATVMKETIELAPGGKKTIPAEWKTSDVLGCEVRADLQTARTSSPRLRNISTCVKPGTFSAWASTSSFRILSHFRTSHSSPLFRRVWPACAWPTGTWWNISAWAFDSYAGLAPQQDEWVSMYWESKTAIRKAIEEEHKYGMKALSYAISIPISSPGEELMRRHPDWFFYRENGQFWGDGIDVRKLDFYRHPDVRGADPFYGGALWTFLNFSLKGPLRFGISNSSTAKKCSTGTACGFDGHFIMWTPACPGARDITGKPVVCGEKTDAINRANTDYTKQGNIRCIS